MASLKGIHLRTGCFCNTGACQKHLSITNEQIKSNLQAGHVCGDNVDLINGLPTGAVRISFGYMSNFGDAQYFLKFVEETFLEGNKACCDEVRNHLTGVVLSVTSKTQTEAGCRPSRDIFGSNGEIVETRNTKPDVKDLPTVNGECFESKLVGWHQNSCVKNGPEVERKSQVATFDPVNSNQVILERICLYPIKSCGAFEVGYCY